MVPPALGVAPGVRTRARGLAAAPSRGEVVGARADDRLDASLLLLVPALCANVWYWQLIIPGLTAFKLGILTVVLAAVAFAASRHRFDVFRDPLRRPMVLMLCIGGLAFIGAPFAIIRGAALNFLIYYFSPSVALALLVALRARTEYALRVIIDGLLAGGLLYAVHFLRAPLDAQGKPVDTIYYDANDGAVVALVCAVLAIARIAIAKSWPARFLLAGCAAVYFAVLVYASSRGAFLALVVTVLCVLFTARTVPLRLRVSVVAGGVLLLSLLAGDSYWSLMRTLLEPAKDYNWSGNSETGRVELWKRGFGYMLEDPVLGSGALNYASKEGRSRWALAQAMEGNGAKWSVAHNAFLTIGVELGFPGLLVFVAMLWVAVRNLKRAANAHGVPPGLRALLEFQLAAIYGYGVASVFISSQYWTFTFVLVALATSGTVAARTAQRAAASAGGPPAGGPAGGGPAHRGPRRAGPIASRGAVPGLSATSR